MFAYQKSNMKHKTSTHKWIASKDICLCKGISLLLPNSQLINQACKLLWKAFVRILILCQFCFANLITVYSILLCHLPSAQHNPFWLRKTIYLRYLSRIHMDPPHLVRTTTDESTLFQHLNGEWKLEPGPTPSTCFLHFNVDFAFKSPLYHQVYPIKSMTHFSFVG